MKRGAEVALAGAELLTQRLIELLIAGGQDDLRPSRHQLGVWI